MGKLVTDAQSTYDTWAAANLPTTPEAWAALSDAETMALYRMENQLKLAISIAQTTEDNFIAQRSVAFAAFEAQKQSELAALQNTWQGYEDNNFTIPV